MKKHHYLFLLFAVYNPFVLSSQTMSYRTDLDESNQQNLMVNVSVLDMNLGFPSISFGAGADVDLYINRISVEANYHFSYWDGKKSIISGTNESQNKLRNFGSFRLGGRLHFVDKKSTHLMKAVLSTDYVAGGTITKYLPMKVPCRSIVALHFGIERYHTPIKGRRDSTITAKDGTKFSEWNSGTNINVSMLYGGFSFIKIIKANMSSNGSRWNFKWYRHAYIDFLYAPLINVENIMLNNKSYIVQGEGAKGFRTNVMGIKFGMNAMAKGGMGLRYEIGLLPGLAGKGIYTTASFGIPIIRHVGLKK